MSLVLYTRACLIAVLGVGCGADARAPDDDGDKTQNMPAPRDAATAHDVTTMHDSGMQIPPVTSGSSGKADSGSSGAGQGSQPSPDANVPGGDAGPECQVDCEPPPALAPELLDVWYFGWSGGNLSFFQIRLCEGGVAAYLFAEGPNDPNPVRLTGSYIASAPDRLIADFMGTPPRPGMALHFELEYAAERDQLKRMPTQDGYSDVGERFSRVAWTELVATCPAQ